MPELRRQRRVAYHTNLRLRAPNRDHSVVAHVHNLSATGAFVTTIEAPQAGTDVLCKLDVAGEACTLKGRIAWVRPPDLATDTAGPAGAGIRFLDLTSRQSELIARLLGPESLDLQPVDVWFEGLRSPIRSQAMVTSDGLRLSTRLPFLRLGSSVKVGLGHSGSDGMREGVLESVMLEPSAEDGIPRLRIVVSAPPLDAHGTIEVPSPTLKDVVSLGLDSSGDDVTVRTSLTNGHASHAFDDARSGTPAPRGDDVTKRTPFFLLPSVDVVPLDDGPTERMPPPELLPQHPPRHSRAAVVVPVAVMALAALLVLAEQPWRSGVPVPSPVAGGSMAASASSTFAKRPDEARPTVTIEPLPAPVLAPAAADAGPLRIREQADETSLVVPLRGSLKGMRHYPLAAPVGLVVVLPRARAQLPTGAHRPGGLFGRLVVRKRARGSELRLTFPANRAARVAPDPAGLRVTLRPKP